jgi:hypothetical protein
MTVLIVEDEIVVSFFIRTLFEERMIGKPFDAPQLWSALGALDEQFV